MPAMSTPDGDKVFAGTVPKIYETFLVPLIFQPYANDLAKRLAARPVQRVLEIAAGTGVVTRALAEKLPDGASIVATDLNQAMLDQAMSVGTRRPVEWRQGDAMQLMFADASFDAVVCQFGVMFFPDRAKAFAEARRVLKPKGILLFNAWDKISENEFADAVTSRARIGVPARSAALPRANAARLPSHSDDRTRPLARRVHRDSGDHDGDRAQPGQVSARSGDCVLPGNAAARRDRGARRWTPRRGDRHSRGAVARRFGDGAVDGKIQAHVIAVER
jgi:SAM-dependent methyltransferase